jgi:hypothetical protein
MVTCSLTVYHRSAEKCFEQDRPACPTTFMDEPREASEPYSRGQWDSALKATPHSPMGDVSYVRALEPTARSGAHGFRSRRPRSLLTCSTIVGLGLTTGLFQLVDTSPPQKKLFFVPGIISRVEVTARYRIVSAQDEGRLARLAVRHP